MTINYAAVAVMSGGVVGLSLGATGGGGSLLAIPILVYVLGVSVQAAAAISLVVVALSALLGVYQRRESGQVKLKAAVIFSITGVMGAWTGAFGHRFMREETVLLLFGLLMIVAAWQMWRQGRHRQESASSENCSERFPRSCWYKVSLIGVIVGLLTGLFGVSGGFVIVPALTLVLGFPIRAAVGTSLLIIALVAVGGIFGHLRAGQIDWQLTGLLLLGSAFGMTGGSWVAQQVSPATLTKSFAAVAIVVGIIIIFRNSWRLIGTNV
jgi:uncharacterized membrane protein YfcA